MSHSSAVDSQQMQFWSPGQSGITSYVNRLQPLLDPKSANQINFKACSNFTPVGLVISSKSDILYLLPTCWAQVKFAAHGVTEKNLSTSKSLGTVVGSRVKLLLYDVSC